ncbi:uncharacterized protein LOC126847673 [Adelges cooleyi]|uniref:uncharacterized protein LOC126847673 n=1 Tax=Adelges cooleyi TaxID=133065 RepID=UPI00217FF9D8|nr:uncharacterized protein LOC126847673 [Adelges cooleyi]
MIKKAFIKSEEPFELIRQDHRRRQLAVWENVMKKPVDLNQSQIYEKEKLQMFMAVNNFITRLSIEKERMINSMLSPVMLENKINECKVDLKSAYEMITRLIHLLNIEKSALASEIDLMNEKYHTDSYRMKVHRNKIVNSQKNKVNWIKDSIDSIIDRYNDIGRYLDVPEDLLFPQPEKKAAPFKLNFLFKHRVQEIEREQKFKETELILADLRSPMDILQSRIIDPGITPIYRLLTTDMSRRQIIYNYSCTLFGMYVEGTGFSKLKAKENAATEMLRAILKKQSVSTLSSHIKTFTERELRDLNPLLQSKMNYVDTLEKTCEINHFPPPKYTLLSRTKNNSKLEINYSVQCEAMDFVAIGHSNKRATAKQTAAQNIIELWEKMKEKNSKKI